MRKTHRAIPAVGRATKLFLLATVSMAALAAAPVRAQEETGNAEQAVEQHAHNKWSPTNSTRRRRRSNGSDVSKRTTTDGQRCVCVC